MDAVDVDDDRPKFAAGDRSSQPKRSSQSKRSSHSSYLHARLDESQIARDQMEHLLHAIVGLNSDLELNATLQRLVTAAMELTGAGYGALGVLGPDDMLVSFLHSGMDDGTVARIGHLPVGKGVLGVLLDEPQSLRLDDLRQHSAAVGFPEHHPPMRALLGVPIMIRQKMFGSLYLTEPTGRSAFSESDEALVQALASAAAVAIDNARLYEQARATARWMTASRAMVAAMADTDHTAQPLTLIAERACELADAEQAIVLVPDDPDLPADEVQTLIVTTAVGLLAEEVVEREIPVDGSTAGAAFRTGVPMITESFRHPIQAFTDVGQRPAIVMPLRAPQGVVGVLVVARHEDQPPFDAGYLDLMSDFADHATVALSLAATREQTRGFSIIADRERIAHDLHDHVIQRLFAVGMDLQGTVARSRSTETTDRLNHAMDDLQSTIEEIRGTIFALQSSGRQSSFRQRVQDAIAELTERRDVATSVRVSRPLSAVSDDLAEHATPVIIEAISNVVRHSGAEHLTVSITVTEDLTIEVTDDGCGIDVENGRRSGLANMARRAALVGGSCVIDGAPGGGTHVKWTAPLGGI